MESNEDCLRSQKVENHQSGHSFTDPLYHFSSFFFLSKRVKVRAEDLSLDIFQRQKHTLTHLRAHKLNFSHVAKSTLQILHILTPQCPTSRLFYLLITSYSSFGNKLPTEHAPSCPTVQSWTILPTTQCQLSERQKASAPIEKPPESAHQTCPCFLLASKATLTAGASQNKPQALLEHLAL